MSNKIGRFEIHSEITKSTTSSVCKALDTESGQTVALKMLCLEAIGEQSSVLIQGILQEAERTKALNSHNVTLLYGTEEIDGQFCAAMEYVQGNSIATMLARGEGFSIWDLLDISRQTCQGLDHAHSHGVVHYSLEPAKVMVQWDGMVKILGFGISSMASHAAQASGKPPEVLHYMSPEQLRGDAMDARSNLFSWGAILYEMVTERKAFDGEDADTVRQQILEQTPVAPDQVNRKIHPGLSEVIMKALSKAPEGRYPCGQDLVNDLEKCKESATKATARRSNQPPQGLNVPQEHKAALPSRPAPVAKTLPAPARQALGDHTPTSARKAAAAAAGLDAGANATPHAATQTPTLAPTIQAISSSVSTPVGAASIENASMSATVVEPEGGEPKVAIDPMMAEVQEETGTRGPSFSEIEELPPLKEVYVATPADTPEPMDLRPPVLAPAPERPKPKVQPRAVAQKAVREIKKTPPKLFMYSVLAAVAIILLIVVGIAFHIHSQNEDENGATATATATTASRAETNPAAAKTSAPAEIPAPTPTPLQVAPESVTAEQAPVVVTPRYASKRKGGRTPAPAPTAIPGQLTISSTPEGAQVHIDGQSEASWITPYNLAGVAPGQHTVSVTKAGYSAETRTIDVTSGSKSFLVVQLAQLTATVSAGSEPAGASIFVDGKDTGRITPAQITVDKGSHTFLMKKQGYLDETATTNLQPGQMFHFAPALRRLGTTDDIKTVGKFKRLFGGGDVSGMGMVSIKTQPKGAQVAINRRILDRATPAEFYLNPGNYVVDLTFSGYKPIHRVITVEKSGKIALDEIMERE